MNPKSNLKVRQNFLLCDFYACYFVMNCDFVTFKQNAVKVWKSWNVFTSLVTNINIELNSKFKACHWATIDYLNRQFLSDEVNIG